MNYSACQNQNPTLTAKKMPTVLEPVTKPVIKKRYESDDDLSPTFTSAPMTGAFIDETECLRRVPVYHNLIRNIPEVVYVMGNSIEIAKRHYVREVSEEWVKKFWALKPTPTP
jgi:hypothetical protein